MKLSKFVVLVALALGAHSLVGCAGMRASSARHAHIEKETEGFAYQKPLSTVWPQARQLLFAAGYQVKDTDASNAETEWKKNGGYRVRYLVSGIVIDDGSCKVQFTKSEQQKKEDGGWYEPDTERDLGMEWDLLQQVSPEAAKKIEAAADGAGEKARKEG